MALGGPWENTLEELLGEHIKLADGLVHIIEDAYSVVGAIRVAEQCGYGAGRYLKREDIPVIDAPVTCFACLSGVKQPDPPTDEPNYHWRECLCAEIDPTDRPCIVCETKRERMVP